MPYCPKCGEEIGEDTRFCPACGAQITDRRSADATNYAKSRGMSGSADSFESSKKIIVGIGIVIVVIAAVLGITFLVIIGGISDTPEGVFLKYIDGLNERDTEKVYLSEPRRHLPNRGLGGR